MTWHAIQLRPAPEQHHAVAEFLVAHTGQAIEERDDGTLVTVLTEAAAADRLERELVARFGPLALERREVPEVDWGTQWRAGLGVRRIGRLAILPTWLEFTPGPGDLPITLDPEEAFGSGEHGSTRGALELLHRWIHPGDTVLDLGAGSGILSIAAARLGAGRVVGVEVDPVALAVAQRNVERNAVADRVRLLEGDAAVIALLVGPCDVLVSNILRLINEALLPEVHRAVRLGGTAIFAGMETGEATDFRAPLLSAGFEILQEIVDDGWWSVAAERV